MADPNDSDNDGISGIPCWVNLPQFVEPRAGAATQGGKYIGRFGKKAGVYSLFQQTVTAYNEDIGITSSFLPHNPVNPNDGVNPVSATPPEVSEEEVNAVVFYLQTLKAPIRRNRDNPQTILGERVFSEIGCTGCHSPILRTGPSPVEALAHRDIRPYTDLLLHDMGSGLNDGYTEGSATPAEWRTPPLWGLGLSPRSQGGDYFLLHDGRARSIEGAILLHGGEGHSASQAFGRLSEEERSAILKFLESL